MDKYQRESARDWILGLFFFVGFLAAGALMFIFYYIMGSVLF